MKIANILATKFCRFCEHSIVKVNRDKWIKSDLIDLHETVAVYLTTSLEANLGQIIIGRDSAIRGRLVTLPPGGKISLGDRCYVGENTQIWSEVGIKIGNDVLIAHNCNIFDSSTHPINYNERVDQYKKILTVGHPNEEYMTYRRKEIVIHNNAWIACNVTLLAGVTIGEAAIVTAGSVVTKDIPPHEMWGGQPARFIKKID